MTAQKSVFASLCCFCLVQKSLAPDSGFQAVPMGKGSPRPGSCQIGDNLCRPYLRAEPCNPLVHPWALTDRVAHVSLIVNIM